jgi:hypothetical protein
MKDKNILFGIFVIVALSIVLYYIVNYVDTPIVNDVEPVDISTIATTTPSASSSQVVYKNQKYRFSLDLSKNWEDYIASETSIKFGTSIILTRLNATTTVANIPILAYPIEQWKIWEKNNFEGYPTAAPMGPTERGRNMDFVFATAPRYNFNFLDGFQEVEEIITTLKTF